MTNGNVLFVVAHEGYHATEYEVPKKIVTQNGYTVITASDAPGIATAHDGSSTLVDLTLNQADAHQYNGIFFIGGPGALTHLDNEVSYALIRQAQQISIPVGGICIAPRILAAAGALKGKKSACFDGDSKALSTLAAHQATYVRKDVVVDEMVVTAAGPAAAKEFGQQIVSILQDNKPWG